MNYIEMHKDLFTMPKEYYFAHCIASDLGMGAGIAVPMQKKFGIRGKIINSGFETKHPVCILTGTVFNLITKKKSNGKPTYDSVRLALECMRDIILEIGIETINKIATPKISAGLDRLQWGKIRDMIHDIFGDLDIEWVVCVWK